MDKQEKTEIKRKHSICISDKITISGIESVVTLQEKEVEVKLSNRFLTITGFGFTPIHLDIDQGNLILAGEVLTLKYSSKADKESFFKKLFK